MPKLEELQDRSERLRHWLSFWQNVILAIFVGIATLIYSFVTEDTEINETIVLIISLLTFLGVIVKITIIISARQDEVSDEIRREK